MGLDVLATRSFVSPNGGDEEPRAEKCSPARFLCFPPNTLAMWTALSMNPTTSDTAYFGGIEISMRT